jgi:hypothetical protein
MRRYIDNYAHPSAGLLVIDQILDPVWSLRY